MMKKTLPILILLGAALSATAMRSTNAVDQTVDTRDYILTVSSPYGEVSFPEESTTTNSWHSSVYSYVSGSPVYEPSGTTLHNQSGFSGEGIAPASGSGDSAYVVLTNVNSTLVWGWNDHYWVTWAVAGQGEVLPVNMAYSGNGAWCQDGENYLLRAAPDYGWLFTGWHGGASGGPSATNLNFTASTPTNLLAAFSDDPDGDGLKNINEWASGADPWMVDTDGDNYDDAFEFANGLSPTRDSSLFVAHIQDNPDSYGLYSSNVVLDVAIGEMLLDVVGTEAILNLQLETSDDLTTWSNAGPAKVWTWTVDGEKKFFRVKSAK